MSRLRRTHVTHQTRQLFHPRCSKKNLSSAEKKRNCATYSKTFLLLLAFRIKSVFHFMPRSCRISTFSKNLLPSPSALKYSLFALLALVQRSTNGMKNFVFVSCLPGIDVFLIKTVTSLGFVCFFSVLTERKKWSSFVLTEARSQSLSFSLLTNVFICG